MFSDRPYDDDRGEHQQRARHRVDARTSASRPSAPARPTRRRARRAGSASPRRTRRRAAGPARRRRRRSRPSGRASAPCRRAPARDRPRRRRRSRRPSRRRSGRSATPRSRRRRRGTRRQVAEPGPLLVELQSALRRSRSARRSWIQTPTSASAASRASDPAETRFSGSSQTSSAAAIGQEDQDGRHLGVT